MNATIKVIGGCPELTAPPLNIVTREAAQAYELELIERSIAESLRDQVRHPLAVLALWDVLLAMRDVVLAMRDVVLAMWDVVLAMRDIVLVMRDVVLAMRDAMLAMREVAFPIRSILRFPLKFLFNYLLKLLWSYTTLLQKGTFRHSPEKMLVLSLHFSI